MCLSRKRAAALVAAALLLASIIAITIPGAAIAAKHHRGCNSSACDARVERKLARTPGCNTRACDRRVARKHRLAVIAPLRRLLAAIRWCESSDRNVPNAQGYPYRGYYQFGGPLWRAVGGRGDPMAASKLEQTFRAALAIRRYGTGPWTASRHCWG